MRHNHPLNFPEFSNAPKSALLCTNCGDGYHLPGQCNRCNCGEDEVVTSKLYTPYSWWLFEPNNRQVFAANS